MPSHADPSHSATPRIAEVTALAAALAATVLWIDPPLLAFFGLAAVARWLLESVVHRLEVVPAVLALSAVPLFRRRRSRGLRARDAWAAFARTIEGTLVDRPVQVVNGVSQGGPAVRVALRNGSAVWESVHGGDGVWTRVRVSLVTPSPFVFLMSGPGAGTRRFERTTDSTAARPIDRVAPLVAAAPTEATPAGRWPDDSPIVSSGQSNLDELVTLRSSDADAARRLLAAPGVTGGLLALASGMSGWDWSLAPSTAGGETWLEFRARGDEVDPDHLLGIHILVTEASDHLALVASERAAHSRRAG